jgi:hypothetical protein
MVLSVLLAGLALSYGDGLGRWGALYVASADNVALVQFDESVRAGEMDLAQHGVGICIMKFHAATLLWRQLLLRAYGKHFLEAGFHVEDRDQEWTGYQAELVGSRGHAVPVDGEGERNADCNREIALRLQVGGKSSAGKENTKQRFGK